MKKFSKVALFLAVLMAVSVLGVSAEGITVTDMVGREVTLAEAAKKVVALTASDAEVLFAVGAGETLVGRGEYVDYPAEALTAPVVQSGNETNVEQIIALEPDAVIMAKMAQKQEQVEALEKAGIAVIVTDAQDIAGVYESMLLLGAVTGHDTEAADAVKAMQDALEALAEKAKANPVEATVYFEVSPLEWGLWTTGQGTFMQEIADLLGLKNTFADVEGWAQISQEQVLERDPDYIVTVAMYFGDGPTPIEEISGRAGWDALKAVKDSRVVMINADELSRPGPRLALGAEALYNIVFEADAAQEPAA